MNEAQSRELNAAIEAVRGREIENVYFVACGGSKAIFDPAQYIFDRESKIPAFVYTANEFNHRVPKGLGNKSLVVTCSHSGNTPETVRATALANEKGALTISFAFKTESPLWETTQHGVSYEWGPDSDGGNRNNGMLFRVVFGVLNVLQPCEKYERALKACDELDRLFRVNMEKFAARADAFGSKYKRAPLIYTMSSGPCYGVAYSSQSASCRRCSGSTPPRSIPASTSTDRSKSRIMTCPSCSSRTLARPARWTSAPKRSRSNTARKSTSSTARNSI